MYSNNILNFQESTTILNACMKKVWKLIEGTTYVKLPLIRHKAKREDNLIDTATPDLSRRGSNDNEGVLLIPQNFRSKTSISDNAVSFLGHSLCVCLGAVSYCNDIVGVFYKPSRLEYLNMGRARTI